MMMRGQPPLYPTDTKALSQHFYLRLSLLYYCIIAIPATLTQESKKRRKVQQQLKVCVSFWLIALSMTIYIYMLLTF